MHDDGQGPERAELADVHHGRRPAEAAPCPVGAEPPLAEPHQGRPAVQRREDGYITIRFDEQPSTLGDAYLNGVDKAVQPLRAAGVDVEYGGPLGELARPAANDLISEAIGFAVAVVVLLIGFGSVLAAGLPLVTALIGVVVRARLPRPAGRRVHLRDASPPTLATMIGLGVGIDYALFLITRHRQSLIDGADPGERGRPRRRHQRPRRAGVRLPR